MYTCQKRLNKIGKNSKGVILPSEWCFSLGLALGSELHMEFDPVSRVIMLKPLINGTINAQRGQNINSTTDYTPQPRQVYPPSPHPKFTPAKWAGLHPSAKTIKLNDLEEMKQKGFEITAEGCDAYDQWVRQQIDSSIYTVRHARTFEDVPDATRNAYLTDVEPLLYFKDDTDKNHARTIWTNTYNMAIQLNSKEEYREAFSASIRQLLTMFTYSADDDLDEL